jgi:hypothetical protein
METTEITSGPRELTLDQNAQSYLMSITKWAKFFAILGFIASGFMVIAAIVMIFLMGNHIDMNDLPDESSNFSFFRNMGSGFGTMMGVLYLLASLLYIFPSLYMYRFASYTKRALLSIDNEKLEIGLKNLKSAYKFVGILTVVILILYGLIFISSFLVSFFLT